MARTTANRERKPRRRRVSRRAKRGTQCSPKSGGPFDYLSSWELRYALWLDSNPDVASYRYEPCFIPYVSNKRTGKVRRYKPDFEVTRADGVRSIVEVKPVKKLTLARNLKKFAAARDYCAAAGVAFEVVTEVHLKALGLLP